LIHGPSLVIGAAIASIAITVAFLGFDGMSNQKELIIEHTPTAQQIGPAKITINTFIDNGSPMLGNPNAPITLIEFGDYQCHFCNVFFHSTEDYILENYCRMRLLKYSIATSTMTISSKNEVNVLQDHVSFLKSQKRELKFKPENFINESILNTEPVASLVQMKKQKITLCQDDCISDEERKSAWHSISQINMVLSSYAQDTLEELETLIMNSENEIASNKVFAYRGFFFGLFPDHELQKLSDSFSYARAVI